MLKDWTPVPSITHFVDCAFMQFVLTSVLSQQLENSPFQIELLGLLRMEQPDIL